MVQVYFSKDQECLVFIVIDSSILAYHLIFKTHSHNENQRLNNARLLYVNMNMVLMNLLKNYRD